MLTTTDSEMIAVLEQMLREKTYGDYSPEFIKEKIEFLKKRRAEEAELARNSFAC